MTPSRFRKARPLALLVALAAVTGCATAPKSNPLLDEARAAYRSAGSDPLVAKGAPIELQKAEVALQTSERLMGEDGPVEKVEHYAYLARQHAAIAAEKGKQLAAEQAIDAARGERDRAIILSRTAEVDASRMRAEHARREAEAALRQVEEATARSRKLAAEAEERNRALLAQIAELEAKQTERGLVLTLGDVLFDTGKAQLKAGAARTVDQLASFLNRYPARKVLVEGHTDSVGGEAYNQALSQQRANSVRLALLDRGIGSQRILVRGHGETYPIASNDNPAGRQQNRRVEVIISDEGGTILERPG